MSAYLATDPTIDGGLVRARRLELGWSERTFAAHLGEAFSTSMVRSIESGNTSSDLTLGDVRRLAKVLELSSDALLVVEGHSATPASSEGSELLRQVGATLRALDSPAPVDALATALGTDLETLAGALTELAATVAVAGLEVRTTDGTVQLVPAFRAAPVEALKDLTRRHLGRVQLDISQANLVSRTARGKRLKSTSNVDRVTKGALLNAGIVETTSGGGLELAEDVSYSLLLTTSRQHPLDDAER
ncbi:helix-turn-helix domain-containing protein [Aeromicrobium fastidiosum]|uniref:Helix-turn-helix transcriptional regulator n=2 Tax=Aeromicrobium fastidiosum TaxID=52699 RepID=A0A641AL50_9ACTN|nr:helix-turn-helix transcriptional regulator [Aeromicrobium fastidiosum]KAA1376416.1 helix-turn-helix transcriptional regulator [Aeromicrobium fastidiosum]